jgi:hypothetical protein
MSNLHTDKWRRMFCGTPRANHEVMPDDGPWYCRACDFIGDQAEATAHVIASQFVPVKEDERSWA